MKKSIKRIFIKNLPELATESEIQGAFGEFGKVTAVEIKERKDCNLKNLSPFFAYINIETDDHRLNQCFRHFADNLWHGQYVELQVAKESFLERLKREREESNKSKDSAEIGKSSIHESVLSNGYNESRVDESASLKNNGFISEDDSKTKFKHAETIVEVKPKKTKLENSNLTSSELKRINSVNQMIKGYQQQKSVIKAALSSVDKKSNKILFDDDFEVPNKVISREETTNKLQENKINSSLFESDNDSENEDNFNFEVKSQFEGKKGQKLLKLQSTYKNDKRFMLDERFINDEEDEDESKNHHNEDIVEEIPIEEEKKKQFEILEQVLGSKIKPSNEQKNQNRKSMLRFDPSQPDHLKYEISNHTEEVPKKKKKRQDLGKEEENKDVSQPEVSKEVFYKVNENLKEALQEQEGFSLLNLYGKKNVEDNEEEVEEQIMIKKINNNFIKEKNPFRYDSSDDNDEEYEKLQDKDFTELPKATEQSLTNTSKFWSEPFFFRDDDFRLQEGFDFVQKIATGEKLEFGQLRRNLKEIIRAKVRNNQRKNRPFKRKLGGNKKKKMIRIKKAMKR